MNSPLVSVCIPTWCGGEYLEEAIQSVLAQSYRNFELIVIDDCSPDETADRIKKYCFDPRLIYLRNDTNLGPQGNWNRCLSVAKGKYIKILPHDDLIADQCLERQVNSLENNAKIVMAFASRTIIRSDGNKLFVKRAPWKEGLVTSKEALRKSIRSGSNLIGEPGAVLFRSEIARKAGGFDSRIPYVLDMDYWSRLLENGVAWYDVTPLASFRISQKSWSVAIGKKQSSEFKHFIRKISPLPHVEATKLDIVVGEIMANVNTWLRRAIYWAVLR